jgi:hypothetical protein
MIWEEVLRQVAARLAALARNRGWRHLKLRSTAGNDYPHHYLAIRRS